MPAAVICIPNRSFIQSFISHHIGSFWYIRKKTTLRLGASGAPCPPDVPGAYNVNSSSGCYRPGCCAPGAPIIRQGAFDAVRCTLPSNHAPSENHLAPTTPDTPGSPTTSWGCLATMNYLLPVTPSVTILLWWRLVAQQVTKYVREDLELSL